MSLSFPFRNPYHHFGPGLFGRATILLQTDFLNRYWGLYSSICEPGSTSTSIFQCIFTKCWIGCFKKLKLSNPRQQVLICKLFFSLFFQVTKFRTWNQGLNLFFVNQCIVSLSSTVSLGHSSLVKVYIISEQQNSLPASKTNSIILKCFFLLDFGLSWGCWKHSISALNPFEVYLLDKLSTSCMGFTGESLVFSKTTITKQLLCGQGSYISVSFSFCIWMMTIFHFCIETFTKIIRIVMLWESLSFEVVYSFCFCNYFCNATKEKHFQYHSAAT